MKKSLKKNFLYNIAYQILAMILPLITVPYLSRVLGANGIGVYSYTYSIVYYFMLLCLLGINNYGNRSIAKVRDDKEKLSKTFLSIYFIQFFMSILMLIIYLGYTFSFDVEYKTISIIQSLFIMSALLDINWFFFGLEEFKITVIRNTLLKIITLIMIFIFVKSSTDIWIYTLIMSLGTVLCNAILVPSLLKRIKFVKFGFKDIKKHIKPIFILFIPVIAVSVYKIMDKIMLGSMITMTEVGYYEQAEKIINVPLALITALGTVMLPRISNLISKGDNSKILFYIKKSINFMMFLAFPMVFGLIAISTDFVPVFLGENFVKSITILNLLSITLIFISIANIIRTEYLLPNEKDKVYIISVISGAIINLIINFIFIPLFKSTGACIGTLAAEGFVMLYQLFAVRKDLPLKEYFKDIFPYFVKALLMYLIICLFKFVGIESVYRVILQVVVGAFIYCILNYKYINSLIDIKKIFKKLHLVK